MRSKGKSIVDWRVFGILLLSRFNAATCMEKYYSKIVGTPVFLESGGRALTRIVDLVIDPENGKIVAFSVAPGFKKLISPMDVRLWTDQILIDNPDDIVSRDDLLRADEVIDMHAPIIKNKVYSQKDGEYLGKVNDYVVHPEMMILKKILVAKSVLGLAQFGQRIIPYGAIYEILPDKIIVNTDSELIEEEEAAAKTLELGRA